MPLDVVFFGSYDVTLHPRVAVLRDGFIDHGFAVTELNIPLGMSTAAKVDAASSVGGMVRLVIAVVRAWAGLWRAGRRHSGDPQVVVVGYMGHFDVHLAKWLWPEALVVLDHMVGLADTAVDRGLAKGLKLRVLERADRAAMNAANVVVVDTVEQHDSLPVEVRGRAVVAPVGATEEWFTAATDRPRREPDDPVKVCYIGLYTPLHGAEVIGRAIARLSDDHRFEFTMVGSGQDQEATRRAAGDATVRWIDWVPVADLPGLVASNDVSLGIFGTTEKALRVVPMKVYQGLAAGCTVVTSDTPAQRRALGESVDFVTPGDDEDLARVLVRIAAGLVSQRDDETDIAVSRSVDATAWFRPERVVEALVSRVVDATDGRRPGAVGPDGSPGRGSRGVDGGSARGARMSSGPALPANAWLRFDLLRPHLETLEPCRALEIGPGRGAIAARLVTAGHDYTGVEISGPAREATTDLLGGIGGGRFRLVPSVDELSSENGFGLLCAFEVLEHVTDDVGTLATWLQLLSPGATVLLSVPAWPERFSDHDAEVGHLRRYDPEAFAALARDLGLVDVSVRLYGFPFGFLLENVRNAMARRIQRSAPVGSETAAERTERSGSWRQPPRWTNSAFRIGTWPARIVQRRFPDRGTGLVLTARMPTGSDPLHGATTTVR